MGRISCQCTVHAGTDGFRGRCSCSRIRIQEQCKKLSSFSRVTSRLTAIQLCRMSLWTHVLGCCFAEHATLSSPPPQLIMHIVWDTQPLHRHNALCLYSFGLRLGLFFFSKALVLTHELTPEKDFDTYLGRRLAPVRPLLSYGRSAKAFPKVEARQAVYRWWKDY